MMTASHCGAVSALSLGLPASVAVAEAKGTLPKAMFVAHAPVSAKLKQRLANDIESIVMLAIMRDANTTLTAGTRTPEILVIGLKLSAKARDVPAEVIELIAGQRKSGIVFVCVRDTPFEGSVREECALAVRRALPGRAGHTPVFEVFHDAWRPAGEAQLELGGASVDDCWASMCSQVILGTADHEELDARITRHLQADRLRADIDKLTRDHQRAKTPAQRNELYAKLHKAKAQLAQLDAA